MTLKKSTVALAAALCAALVFSGCASSMQTGSTKAKTEATGSAGGSTPQNTNPVYFSPKEVLILNAKKGTIFMQPILSNYTASITELKNPRHSFCGKQGMIKCVSGALLKHFLQ